MTCICALPSLNFDLNLTLGLDLPENVSITSWLGEKNWKPGKTKAAHPNSRFCAPSDHCPIMDKDWENPKGVPISAILFGGRRPQGVPLVYQSFNWKHGVFVASSMSSEATAAAEHKSKTVMRDPFAMRPFFGYNFGKYMEHWLGMEKPNRKMPKIFHVNWFRIDDNGHFLWPGKLIVKLPYFCILKTFSVKFRLSTTNLREGIKVLLSEKSATKLIIKN